MTLIPARLKDADLLREVEIYKSDLENFHIWWLGQSGFLLMWQGTQILLDPYLSDSLTEKYKNTDKPHVRISERVIDPAILSDISVVTSSHNHTDHLDADTLVPVLANNPNALFIIPEANRQFVAERIRKPLGFPTGLDAASTITYGLFTFYGVPAAHNELEKDENGLHKFLGYVIRFGKWVVYHSGDTLWYEGMVETLKRFDIDLALLPINGNNPARRVAGNLNASEAAELGRAIGAKMVIPCHYDMFAFNTADPQQFVNEALRTGQPYTVLPIGGHFSSHKIK
jgi:L-ascorbate metabolism protein UlaG (beta-lactamase superfamily)